MSINKVPHISYAPVKLGPERVIVRNVGKWMVQAFSPQAVWIGFDLQLGSGMPDIVAVAASERMRHRIRSHEFDSVLLAFIRLHGPVSSDKIESHFPKIRPKYISSRLTALLSHGFLGEETHGIILGDGISLSLSHVVAVEAKVSNWRAALTQASRNRLFANRSFIALPADLARRIAYQPAFVSVPEIGLLAVDEDGEVECLMPGIDSTPKLWSYYYSAVMSSVRFQRGWSDAV